MVRREEQPWQSRATVLVDNRRHAHRGSGPSSSLEYAVTVAASVAMHLAQRGFRVRLVTADGVDPEQGWHEHGAASTEAGPLLESLAVLQDTPRVDIDCSWLSEPQQTGLLVAVLGGLVPEDRAALGRLRHASSTPMAVLLDVGRWVGHAGPPAPPADAAVALMTASGWRAVGAAPEDPLPTVWQQLGLLGRRRSAAPTPQPVRQSGGGGG
jgi:uncharacterized protein (DUF58 family)